MFFEADKGALGEGGFLGDGPQSLEMAPVGAGGGFDFDGEAGAEGEVDFQAFPGAPVAELFFDAAVGDPGADGGCGDAGVPG